ncbi:MAG: hypothetical protein U1E22_09890 [Coriobacteriia bacterium]|nr:hypothetical protein [Coriobacteriia bacterium]
MVPHEVTLFLRLVREARDARRLTYRRNRDKNRETLADLGWTPRNMFNAVVALQPEDALGIPWDNRNPGHITERVCEFGMALVEQEVYVKIAIVGLDDTAAGCVVSFHFAEKKLTYPFK